MVWKLLICTFIFVQKIILTVCLPQAYDAPIEKFQHAVQQQTFQSVLNAIERRLANLDNIYSIQLSETLQSKLEQYHRKLESLDAKIIHLETIIMLNLDKISENISTKNYRDDVTKAHTYRKLDNMYDSLSHRMSYMDKKYDMAFEKIQNRMDAVLLRLEKMEENMMQRNSDIEAELSDTQYIIEEFKNSLGNSENTLINITNNILNQSITSAAAIKFLNITMQNSIKQLNQSLNVSIEKIQDNTLRNLNLSMDNKDYLTVMHMDLKEDYNNYANKVADMNIDIWKRNDVAEISLNTIETVINSTKIEIQNGIRALMLQIGKNGKDLSDKNSYESLKKSINLSLEKILSNQGLFLESCHRVQMDESQIESELSAMLEKLIDMLEKKMTTVMKDIKTLEKTVKNHDSRINRNLYQANTNIISLFEKTTKNQEFSENELHEIKFYINSLFSFVQDVLPKNKELGISENIFNKTLNDMSLKLSRLIQIINDINENTRIMKNEVKMNFTTHFSISKHIIEQLENTTSMITNKDIINHDVPPTAMFKLFQDIKILLLDINNTISGPRMNHSSNSMKDREAITHNQNLNKSNSIIETKNCFENYGDLIDIRIDKSNCNTTNTLNNPNVKNDTIPFTNLKNKPKNSTSQNLSENEDIRKAILEIFGKPAVFPEDSDVKNNITKVKQTKRKNSKKCPPKWANLIDIRFDSGNSDEDCNKNKAVAKTKKNKSRGRIKSKFDDGESFETSTDDSEEFDTTTETTTTETTTNDINTSI